MKLTISHTTSYSYSTNLRRSVQLLKLRPQPNYHQQVNSWEIDTPCPIFHAQDWFGNSCDCLVIDNEELNAIAITARGIVNTNCCSINYDRGGLPLQYFLNSTNFTQFDESMHVLTQQINVKQINLDSLHQLSASILLQVPYQVGMTNALTTATDAIKIAAGVCQDHSHIMLAITRHLGLPARYVSGYLYTADTDHVASHAWVEVWLNNAWHSLDISNQCVAADSHVILAYGLDCMDAAPIRGSRVGGGLEFLDAVATVSNQ